jgi:hypothetical protein
VDNSLQCIPFKRVTLQLRTTHEEFNKVVNDLMQITEHYHISEASEVLADGFKFYMAHAEEPFEQRLANMQVSSSSGKF